MGVKSVLVLLAVIWFVFGAEGFMLRLPTAFLRRGGQLTSPTAGLPSATIMGTRRISLRMSSTIKPGTYLTTPIYYVNGDPHLGHAYTSTITDIIARYHRLDNREVYFLTGTDEHGQKVEQSAAKAGQSTYVFSTDVSNRFKEMTTLLECTHSDFIRTTEDRHKAAVQALWTRLEKAGYIYLGAYEGWYSVRDEAFYTDLELVDGKAPTGADVEWVREESYFFRLSQFTDRLREFYEQHPDFIAPKGRRNEVLAFINQENGLKDLSISRTTFSWGVPVPGDSKHVIYVWLDALTNYLSALGFPNEDSELFKKYWPASLHVVGKDILRFHAIFWPAFLMAAGLEPPKRIFAHGWWTRDGEKMSKSVGNVLDPFQLVKHYGVDYVRYFMAAEFPFGNDGDFSHDAFCTRINVDLANDLGNLAQRTLTMVERHLGGVVPAAEGFTTEDQEVLQALRANIDEVRGHLAQQSIKSLCDSVIALAKLGNKYIYVQAPWVLAKSDPERLRTVVYVLMELLRHCAIMLQPVTPHACARMLDMLGVPSDPAQRTIDALVRYSSVGNKVASPTPLFPKVQPPPETSTTGATEAADGINHAATKAALGAELAAMYEGYGKEQLSDRLALLGDEIRALKAQKTSKEDLAPLVKELLYLKERVKAGTKVA